MKKTLLLSFVALSLCSCATRSDGTKTFAGLDRNQWKGVGLETGAAYVDAVKQKPSGKTSEDITPPAKKETSWLAAGLALLGL